MLWRSCLEYLTEISPDPDAAATSPAGPTRALGSPGSPSPADPTAQGLTDCSQLPDKQMFPVLMQRAAENTALSIHFKGDNTDTHLGFSRGSGSFRPKPTGLFSASSTVSSWNSASTLPWRGNMSEPQLHVLFHRPACYHMACQDSVFFSQFHLQMLRAINFSLQALATESLTLQPVETVAWLETNCFADKALYCNALPSYLDLSAASHTGIEQNPPLGTNNGPLAGQSAASLSWDSWHLPVWGRQRP